MTKHPVSCKVVVETWNLHIETELTLVGGVSLTDQTKLTAIESGE